MGGQTLEGIICSFWWISLLSSWSERRRWTTIICFAQNFWSTWDSWMTVRFGRKKLLFQTWELSSRVCRKPLVVENPGVDRGWPCHCHVGLLFSHRTLTWEKRSVAPQLSEISGRPFKSHSCKSECESAKVDFYPCWGIRFMILLLCVMQLCIHIFLVESTFSHEETESSVSFIHLFLFFLMNFRNSFYFPVMCVPHSHVSCLSTWIIFWVSPLRFTPSLTLSECLFQLTVKLLPCQQIT